MKEITFLYLLLMLFVTSCRNGLIQDTVYNNDVHLNGDPDVLRVIPPSNYEYKKGNWYYSDETYFSEKNAIDHLNMLIKKHPEKTKYQDVLEGYKNRLYEKYRKRVEDRMVFLRNFYSDMYKLSNLEFSKKYKKHCDKDLLYRINRIKFQGNSDIPGDHWFAFTDLKTHPSKDYKFSYMNGDPRKVGNSDIALYIYEDSVKTASIYQYKQQFHLTNKEDKWYKVSLGENFLMVKVEGETKYIKITGVVNPYVSLAYMNEPQIPKYIIPKGGIGSERYVLKFGVNTPFD